MGNFNTYFQIKGDIVCTSLIIHAIYGENLKSKVNAYTDQFSFFVFQKNSGNQFSYPALR